MKIYIFSSIKNPIRLAPTFDVIQDTSWLCQRLAQANTRRREQLQYWKVRPYEAGPMANAVESAPEPGRDEAGLMANVMEPAPKPGRGEASTIKLGQTSRSQTTQQTVFTRHSFSTAALSDVHNTKTVERPRTIYTPTTVGQDRVNFVPDPPKTDADVTTFHCPYYGMTLDKNEMQERQTWK